MKMRKVVASGLVGAAGGRDPGCLWRRARGRQPSGSGERQRRGERLPALHRLRRRRLRRQVVQPARLRGRQAGRRRARRRVQGRRVQHRERLRPEHREPGRQGCDAIVTVGFALAAATKESAAANPDIEYVLIDDSADGGDDGDLRRQDRRAEHQADPLRHRPGGVPRRLRRRRLHQDRQSSAPSAAALPDRHDLHGRLQAGRRVLERQEKGKDVKVVGWDGTGRRRSPVASRPTRRPPTPLRSSSTRAST